MDAPSLPLPAAGRCLVARMDYGYPASPPASWRQEDLDWTGEAPFSSGGRREGSWILGAEHLLGWARTKRGEAVWERLEREAARGPLVLQCRFPRHARALGRLLEARRIPAGWWETRADGSVPPLYEAVRGRPALLRLHLEREWQTGMAAARGGIALLRIAGRLAAGPKSAGDLARGLGLTSGAVRSYLRWMEDAALLRREGRDFALRHPLLATLFSSAVPLQEPAPKRAVAGPSAPPALAGEAAPPAAPAPTSRPWNPIELD